MKSSEQLEQQALELSKSPQKKEGIAGQEQLAVAQEKLAQQLEAKKKILEQEKARQDAELGVVGVQASVNESFALEGFVGAEKKLKYEVLKHTKEQQVAHPETRHRITSKPIGSSGYGAGMTEQQIAERVEAGKQQAVENVENLIGEAGGIPVVGSVVQWLEQRARVA